MPVHLKGGGALFPDPRRGMRNWTGGSSVVGNLALPSSLSGWEWGHPSGAQGTESCGTQPNETSLKAESDGANESHT